MKQDTKIEIKKLSPVENPLAPTPEFKDYKVGEDNGEVSLPVEYVAEGILEADIEVGKSVRMLRTKRNGVMTPGLFSTSPIQKIEGDKLYTQNSVYVVKQLE
jgi:hypothetical protein